MRERWNIHMDTFYAILGTMDPWQQALVHELLDRYGDEMDRARLRFKAMPLRRRLRAAITGRLW